jgi:glucose/arabinose dehydrogenase
MRLVFMLILFICAALIIYFAQLRTDNKIYFTYAQKGENTTLSENNISIYNEPIIKDPNLKAELIVKDLDYPTSMAFLGQNDILVLEKDKGKVQRILNGQMLEKPLLDVNVSGYGEDGLVGISVSNDSKERSNYVYLYYTESDSDPYYFFNYSLDVLAKDVNQLHSKVYYYDADKREIPVEYFIFDGKNGTFENTFNSSSIPPEKAEYLKVQMWIRQNLKPSSFLIDSIKIDNRSLGQVNWIYEDKSILSVSKETNEPISGNASLRVNVQPFDHVNETLDPQWMVVSTDFIPLKDYRYHYNSLDTSGDITTENKPKRNVLYRYEFVNNQLINPKLLLELPVSTYGLHNGGKIVVGPDNNVYFTIGDVAARSLGSDSYTKAQNYEEGTEPDGRAGILHVTKDGKLVGKGILGGTYPLNLYYAYGIRNSFGIDFDPVTGNLWDTEDGPGYGDEINLVKPGFNSGADRVYGFWKSKGNETKQQEVYPDNLTDFDGRGVYSDPEFEWHKPIGITSVKFLNSEKYGKGYENDMFVADFNSGNIYHFDLNKNRTELSLNGSLKDKIASKDEDSFKIIFAQAPGGITDIQVGPDGYIYFVSLNVTVGDCDPDEPGCFVSGGIKGEIFRIVPKN